MTMKLSKCFIRRRSAGLVELCYTLHGNGLQYSKRLLLLPSCGCPSFQQARMLRSQVELLTEERQQLRTQARSSPFKLRRVSCLLPEHRAVQSLFTTVVL